MSFSSVKKGNVVRNENKRQAIGNHHQEFPEISDEKEGNESR